MLLSFFSGCIFSVGLVISQMTNPDKVKSFLDVFGDWDYSLAFVMLSAILTNVLLTKIFQRSSPIFMNKFYLPKKIKIDRKIILGAFLFGAGWGLIGLCPGPGIVNVVSLSVESLIFVGSMIIGMYLFSILDKKLLSKK